MFVTIIMLQVLCRCCCYGLRNQQGFCWYVAEVFVGEIVMELWGNWQVEPVKWELCLAGSVIMLVNGNGVVIVDGKLTIRAQGTLLRPRRVTKQKTQPKQLTSLTRKMLFGWRRNAWVITIYVATMVDSKQIEPGRGCLLGALLLL